MPSNERDPHFLHGQRALQALLSPPVEAPATIAWIDGDQLLVADAAGGLHEVDPVFGTRRVGDTLRSPSRIAVSPAGVAVADRAGRIEVRDGPEDAVRWTTLTGLVTVQGLGWWRQGLLVVGEDAEARRVLLYRADGRLLARARVARRVGAGITPEGEVFLARSTTAGLSLTPFGERLPNGTPTAHRLRVEPSLAVVGVAPVGVTVWPRPGVPPVTVKLHDVTAAALSPDGAVVAMGTRLGQVGVVEVGAPTVARRSPTRVEGHDAPVTAVEFAPRGRRFATVGERCWVWAW